MSDKAIKFLREKGIDKSDSIITINHEVIDLEELLDQYTEYKQNTLDTESLEKEIEPYLSDQVKSFWKKWEAPQIVSTGQDTYDSQGRKLYVAYLQIVIEKTHSKVLEDQIKFTGVEDSDIQKFARMINKAAELGLIHTGALCPPSKIQLATLRMSQRWIIFFYPLSHLTTEELKKYNSIFTEEGELGNVEINEHFNVV